MALTNYSYLDATGSENRLFPTTVKPSFIRVEIEQPTLTSTTNALTTQRRSLGAHRIGLEYTYGPMSADEVQPFIAFFSAMRGSAKAFQLNAPKELINDLEHITDDATHTSTGSYSKGAREVIVNNFGANLATAMKGGNFIKFSNHNKTYVVSADGGSDASGNCRIRFEPGLVENITSSTTLNTFDEDIPLHVIFANDTINFDVNSALVYGFKVSFKEQWED